MSNTQTKNVPELRFPGFEGEYSLDIFGNLATNKSEKFNPQNENASIDIELDCIEQNTGRLIKIYNSKEFSSQKNKFNPQNVLYGKLRPYLNKYYFTKKSGVCSSEIWVLKSTKEDKLLNLFLYYFIQTKRYSDVASKSAGSKMPRADWGLIENIRVYFPELCEQQKIGQFFSKLDRQIELEEQKLELLQQQKKGYMQKIFSQELRFKDENGNDYPDWEEKQLGELSQIVRGASPRPIKDPKWFNKESDIGWLRISDVTNQNGKIYHLEQKLSIEGQEKTRVLVTTHLLLSIAASIGKPVMNFVKTGVHDGFLIFLNPKFNLFFMYYWLEYFKDKWSKYGQPGSQVNLNTEIVKSQTLNMPSNHEQEKVGQFFNRNEKLIELQQEKIMYLKRRKQVLLQKMFI
ncbi:TPA: restriction endonuclease subunit S [Staphylococcus aureus]|uniref:restriction endonuclease subunit S n=1 Tax=Staphylococcus TaxID=1279 RepID=UPI000241DE37|nr:MULTISPECIES: restriction endonuclease subunit S [Staphylococcus]HDK9092720.1 restriction endonuclease subunit S [Staphylococcus aureus CC80-24329]AEW65814.1 type I restriction modification DNA specificity domain protein [Staphylococcus aureus subsp. aureus 11819-97]ALF33535.1 restriction endonuclease subunit S [Staphylococcus aureus]EHP01668.1 type I restriction modification DNA specificity domain protein [Staphylococcus aureus subsp. aureus 21333]EJX3501948.1 restriction endonuclease subu